MIKDYLSRVKSNINIYTNKKTLRLLDGTYKSIYKGKSLDFDDLREYVEDNTQNTYPHPKAISKIDEENLKQIAKDLGIEYVNMQKTSNVDKILKKISRDISRDTQTFDVNTCNDTYYIFAIMLIMVLFFELINYKRRIAI